MRLPPADGPSHELAARIGERDLDIAICAAPATDPPGTVAHLLLRDPYILAVPRGTKLDNGLDGLSHLSFLRRDMDQLMGQQIETYLSEMKLHPQHRFEMDSNQSISALVASGTGWTITTPLSLLRAGVSPAASTRIRCPENRSNGGSCSMRRMTGPARFPSRSRRWPVN
jgi:DNA-binding transcriptional LysR family regulator